MHDQSNQGLEDRPRPWDGLISAAELEVYRGAGFFKPVEFGERPALIVVDAQYNFTGEAPEPVAAAAKRYRFSCGEHAWNSLPHIRALLDLVREKGMPVAYTKDTETFPDPTAEEAARGNEFVAELAPRPEDAVVEKRSYSGFFSTRMLSYLVSLNVDTVVVCGGTTSGCVRATVTDAFDYRFKVFLVEECVFDRSPTVHRSNLFDIAAKTARVVSLEELTMVLAERDFHAAFKNTGDSPTWRYTSD